MPNLSLNHNNTTYTFTTNCLGLNLGLERYLNDGMPDHRRVKEIANFFEHLMLNGVIKCAGNKFTYYEFKVKNINDIQKVSTGIQSTLPTYTIEELLIRAAKANDMPYPKTLECDAPKERAQATKGILVLFSMYYIATYMFDKLDAASAKARL